MNQEITPRVERSSFDNITHHITEFQQAGITVAICHTINDFDPGDTVTEISVDTKQFENDCNSLHLDSLTQIVSLADALDAYIEKYGLREAFNTGKEVSL